VSVVNFTILILVVYLVGLKLVSILAHKKSEKNTSDYFLASRNVGLFLLLATTVASVFSTATVVAGPANFYGKGTDYLWYFFLVMLPIVMMPFMLKFYRIGSLKRFVTPAQMLGDFYNSKSIQVVAAIVGLVSLIPYAVAQLVAVGKTFDSLTAGVINYEFGVTIAAIGIGMYLFFGGSRAVIWTDAIQGVLFSILLVISAFLTIKWVGGLEVFASVYANSPKSEFNVSFRFYEYLISWFSFFFLPYIWQRAYMAKSAKTLTINIALFGVIVFVLFFIVWIIGTASLSIFPDGISDVDNVLGAIFAKHAPYFGAFVLVAAFAAGMSTVDSQLLSTGSIISKDLKDVFFKDKLKISEFSFARLVTILTLVFIYFLSIGLKSASIIDLVVLGISFCIVFVPVVSGMFYWKRSSKAGALISLLFGALSFLINQFTDIITYDLLSSTVALVVSVISFIVFSLIFPSSTKYDEYQKILKRS